MNSTRLEKCPSDEQLQGLLLAEIHDDLPQGLQSDPQSSPQSRFLAAHLDTCPKCQQRLEQLALGGLSLPPAERLTQGACIAGSRLASVVEQLTSVDDPPVAPGNPAWDPLSVLNKVPDDPEALGRLGDYRILRVLGRGNMGVVFLGWDANLNRHVAIKVLHPLLAVDADARERFIREAQAAASLHNEHVVTIYAVNTVDNPAWFVMQYVQGSNLQEYLAQQGDSPQVLPLAEVQQMAEETAEGLEAAHALGLVHRDIKPGNLLRDSETGIWLVSDFGLARAVDDTSLTRPGVIAGTPEFMAPEQARGEAVDQRADLFALGSVLYLALSGRLPFQGNSTPAILRAICDDDPEPLSRLAPEVPGWLASLVHRLLQKDPDRRFATAAEFLAALRNRTWQHSRLTPAHQVWGVTTWLGRLVAAAGLLVVALLTVLGLASWRQRAREIVQPPAATATSEAMPLPFRLLPADTDPARMPPGAVAEFLKLGEAIAAAADGDTIEIQHEGPHAVESLWVDGKRLTLRAAAGIRPLLVHYRAVKQDELPLVTTDRDLVLQGISLRWAGTIARPSELPTKCIVKQTGGVLTARDCHFFVSRGNACIALDQAAARIERCLFTGSEALGVYWRPSGNQVCRCEHTAFLTRIAVMVDERVRSVESQAELLLRRNTFRCVHVLNLLLDPPFVRGGGTVRGMPGEPARLPVQLRVSLERNAVAAERLLMLLASRPQAPSDLGVRRVLGSSVEWLEHANVYQVGMAFVAAAGKSQLLQPRTISPIGDTLDNWLRYWEQADAGSVEAEVQFSGPADSARWEDHRVLKVVSPSGPMPADFGL